MLQKSCPDFDPDIQVNGCTWGSPFRLFILTWLLTGPVYLFGYTFFSFDSFGKLFINQLYKLDSKLRFTTSNQHEFYNFIFNHSRLHCWSTFQAITPGSGPTTRYTIWTRRRNGFSIDNVIYPGFTDFKYGRVTVLSVFACISDDQNRFFLWTSANQLSRNPDKKSILTTGYTQKNG